MSVEVGPTLKDLVLLLVALAAAGIAITLLMNGIRSAAKNLKHSEAGADWGRLWSTLGLGAVLSALGIVALMLSADEGLGHLETFRSLSGAHSWSLRLVWLGLAVLGVSLAAHGALPELSAWWSRRHHRRRR